MDLRSLEIPVADDTARRSMVAGELADALGERIGDRVFDTWDAAQTGANANPSLQVISIPQSIATNVAESIASAGLDCEIIDGPPFVLSRAIELAEGPSDAPRIALDWGFSGANLVVVRGGIPIYSRLLRGCGIERLAADVASALGVDLLEAEKVLVEHGLPDTDSPSTELQRLIAQVTNDSVRSLLEQLDKTLNYVESEWPGCLPESLWLFGGGATIQNLPRQLAERVGMGIQTWSLTGNGTEIDKREPLLAAAAALSALAWKK